MPIPVETLKRHGIIASPAQLERLLLAVIEALPEVSPSQGAFTARERVALHEAGLDASPLDADASDPMAEAAASYAALLATSLTVAEAARRLSLDPSRVRQRLTARTLHGIKVAGEWRIPAYQFDGDHLVPGLDRVVRGLPTDLHPLAIADWFQRPDPDLEWEDRTLSPREWLQLGGDPASITPPEPQV